MDLLFSQDTKSVALEEGTRCDAYLGVQSVRVKLPGAIFQKYKKRASHALSLERGMNIEKIYVSIVFKVRKSRCDTVNLCDESRLSGSTVGE